MSIPFTQFRRPRGHRVPVTIDRPAEIEEKAKLLINRGYVFEIEELMTGQISMEIVNQQNEEDSLAMEICANGPEVPVCVDKMVNEAFAAIHQIHQIHQ